MIRKILTPRFDGDGSVGGAPRWVHEQHLLDDCRAFVAEVRFDATALPVDELVFTASAAGVQLVVDIRVPDRDKEDVELIHIWRTLVCPWEPLRANGAQHLVRWMRETIANVLAHEVDESITLRGARVFDPHRPLLLSGGAP